MLATPGPMPTKTLSFLLAVWLGTSSASANNAIECFSASGDAHVRVAACTATLEATPGADPRTRAVAFLNRGVAYREMENFGKALKDFEDAATLDPNDPAIHLERGKVAVLAGRDDLAIAALTQAITLDLRIADAYVARGAILSRLGQAEAARRDFTTAVSLVPDDASLRMLTGQSHLDAGELDLALLAFDAAVRMDPSNSLALFGRGVVRAATGDAENSITDFSEVLALDGPTFKVLFNRGSALLLTDQPVNAIADFTAALSFEPNNAQAHFRRGQAAVAAEDLELAVQDFTEAVRIDPLMGDALVARADVHILRFDFQAARRDTSSLVDALPNVAKAWRLRGRIRFYQGDFVGASDDFRAATSKPDTQLTDDLWLYLAQRRAGFTDVPLSATAEAAPLSNWPSPLINLATGRLSGRDARDLVVFGAQDVQQRLCDVAYILGQRFIFEKDISAARASLREAVDLGDEECLGYRAALVELERLGPEGS